RELHGLAAAPADQGAGLERAVHADVEARAPGDGGLAVDEGGGAAAVEHHRGAVGGDRDPAGAGEGRVEQAARGDARALDALDVGLQVGVVGEDVGAVDGDALVLQVEQVDVFGVVGQEQQALPLDAHRGDAL